MLSGFMWHIWDGVHLLGVGRGRHLCSLPACSNLPGKLLVHSLLEWSLLPHSYQRMGCTAGFTAMDTNMHFSYLLMVILQMDFTSFHLWTWQFYLHFFKMTSTMSTAAVCATVNYLNTTHLPCKFWTVCISVWSHCRFFLGLSLL